MESIKYLRYLIGNEDFGTYNIRVVVRLHLFEYGRFMKKSPFLADDGQEIGGIKFSDSLYFLSAHTVVGEFLRLGSFRDNQILVDHRLPDLSIRK